MALTAQHDLPFPDPTGDVRMGAGDIRALAEALDVRLGGALFRAQVENEPIADNGQDDLLDIVLAVDDSEVFEHAGANLIRYIGIPTVIATLYGQVTWEAHPGGTRRMAFNQNAVEQASSRVTPDAESVTQGLVWPVLLTTGDTLGLKVRQTSGGDLDVVRGRLRCVVHGIQPA